MQIPPPAPKSQKILFWKALALAVEFGFVIALPLIAFGWLGRFLDSKYRTNYWVFLGIGLAICASTIVLYKRFAKIINDFKQK